MPFGLVPEILYSIDVIVSVCKELTVVDSLVMKARYVQSIVGFKGVGIHYTVWINTFFNDRQKSLRLGIGYNSRVDLITALKQSKYSYFTSSTSTLMPLRLPPK